VGGTRWSRHLRDYSEIEQATVTALADAMAVFLCTWDHPAGIRSRMLDALIAEARQRADLLVAESS
jgi:hypothetical protein